MDISGELLGANHWAGVRDVVAELQQSFWKKTPWPGHACDLCRRMVVVNGEPRTIKAAVIDGCNNTRHPKCKVYECALDLESLGGTR